VPATKLVKKLDNDAVIIFIYLFIRLRE
jgi:hypothetical protein